MLKKVRLEYSMSAPSPQLRPAVLSVLRPEPEGAEKRVTIECFFDRATTDEWRDFVLNDTRQALYYELLYNPETVVTFAVNYLYHYKIWGDTTVFDQVFGEQMDSGHVYTTPQCVEWLLACVDLFTIRGDKIDINEFGWTPHMDSTSAKFNVDTRVAFDNTAAWPQSCTNHAVHPSAQGQNADVDMGSVYVISTESHQLDAFLGRPIKQANETYAANPRIPALTISQACVDFVEQFYGPIFTENKQYQQYYQQNHHADEPRLTQSPNAKRFFNRGTDFSVLTKCKELTYVKVPVIKSAAFDIVYMLVRVRLDAVLGR
ncbi:MAG: hypothetical protein ACRC02_14880, partial [Vogesella sp.]|uniref:hypothetical protein n=1 Tax=Vogesella sp. TaxID=1904252 RepID=UPI003F2CB3E7